MPRTIQSPKHPTAHLYPIRLWEVFLRVSKGEILPQTRLPGVRRVELHSKADGRGLGHIFGDGKLPRQVGNVPESSTCRCWGRARTHASISYADFIFLRNSSQRFFCPATIFALPPGDNLEDPAAF